MIYSDVKKVEAAAREMVKGLRSPSEDDVHAAWVRALNTHEKTVESPARVEKAVATWSWLNKVAWFLAVPTVKSATMVMFNREKFEAVKDEVDRLQREATKRKEEMGA